MELQGLKLGIAILIVEIVNVKQQIQMMVVVMTMIDQVQFIINIHIEQVQVVV
jgi:hypothetical protein